MATMSILSPPQRQCIQTRARRGLLQHAPLLLVALFSASGPVAVVEASGSVEMQFATPIYVYNVDKAKQENMKLDIFKVAQDLREADPVGRVLSNRGGWRSQSDLHRMLNAPPVLAEVRKQVNAAVSAFWKAGMERTPHAKGKKAQPKLKLEAMWMNVLGLGDSNIVHKHAQSFISGVYYVNMPKLPGPGGAGGSIKFRDPRPQTSVYDDMEWMGMGAEVQVNPVEGMILLWPSWLEHYVEPIVPSSLDKDRRMWAEGADKAVPGVLGRIESSPPESLRIVIPFNVGLGKSRET